MSSNGENGSPVPAPVSSDGAGDGRPAGRTMGWPLAPGLGLADHASDAARRSRSADDLWVSGDAHRLGTGRGLGTAVDLRRANVDRIRSPGPGRRSARRGWPVVDGHGQSGPGGRVRRHRPASARSLRDYHGGRSARLAGGKQSLAVWVADLQGRWLVGRIPGADHCRGTSGAEPLSPDLPGSSGGCCERRRSVRGRVGSRPVGLRLGGAAQRFGPARPDLLASALRHRPAVGAARLGSPDSLR